MGRHGLIAAAAASLLLSAAGCDDGASSDASTTPETGVVERVNDGDTLTLRGGDKVRLGVEAPKEVPVHRQEVYDAIHRNVGIGEPKVADGDGTAGST